MLKQDTHLLGAANHMYLAPVNITSYETRATINVLRGTTFISTPPFINQIQSILNCTTAVRRRGWSAPAADLTHPSQLTSITLT